MDTISKEDDMSDNKYDKIERQTSQVQRTITITILALLSFVALFVLSSYTNAIEGEKRMTDWTLVEASNKNYRGRSESLSKAKAKRNVVINDNNEPSEQELEKEFTKLDKAVRTIKETGIIMEIDKHSKEVTENFKKAARALMIKRYGNPPYRVQMDIEFQDDDARKTPDKDRYATLLIEMAPIELIPYSCYNFLEMARGYKKGGFHRNAGHVLQAAVTSSTIKKPLAFQEYSAFFPHMKGTVGYCGRPSSVCWYVSIMDNSKNHGPGSQQKDNPYEADANFGTVIQGMDDVVPRIHRVMKPNQFLDNKDDWVLVNAMHILVTDGDNEELFHEWKPNK